ncbi:MAG: hypothetical protein JWN40_4971 [Phycisphaerales bacterium]|nr:hypothetical protein [Phycisphaerales bacterium]
MRPRQVLTAILILCLLGTFASAQILDPTLHHLRHGEQREWDDFPAKPESDHLQLTFNATANPAERTLSLRHRDLRHVWKLSLNGQELATLPQDENPMRSLIAVSPGALRNGANALQITCAATTPEADDIMIGDIALLDPPRTELLTQAAIDITVTDADTAKPLPCRLTITDDQGDLVPLGIESDAARAVRTGVVYTATGRATLRLPAGQYTLYASRGFEWGIDSTKLDLKTGPNEVKRLALRREVDTPGYVAADTHVHTFTYSRHGDATLAERMITLAGEGVELPIATDHNLPIDYEEAAQAAGVRQYFTPVIGNEVTTPKLGHFNVFPIDKTAKLIDFRAATWAKLFANIDALAPGAVVILNHARDTHGGFRPFDPSRHIALTGEDLDGQLLRANAMEVINSGATLNDPLLLYRDWMACLNRGLSLTPIGASDSHDVTRFIVGQGRTYVRADDKDPGHIDVKQAIESIKQGRVLVSYGLLADIKVNGQFGIGDLVPTNGDVEIEVKVLGPSWTRARHIALFANGIQIRQADIDPADAARPGLKSAVTWRLPKPAHDVYLTAVATGPGVIAPYSPAAKPYQRTSPHWEPYVFACTAAVYLDCDNSKSFQSAFDYASQIVTAANDNVPVTLQSLAGYDAAVVAQAAGILRTRHKLPTPESVEEAALAASDSTRAAFIAFAQSWRESAAARAAQPPP